MSACLKLLLILRRPCCPYLKHRSFLCDPLVHNPSPHLHLCSEGCWLGARSKKVFVVRLFRAWCPAVSYSFIFHTSNCLFASDPINNTFPKQKSSQSLQRNTGGKGNFQIPQLLNIFFLTRKK